MSRSLFILLTLLALGFHRSNCAVMPEASDNRGETTDVEQVKEQRIFDLEYEILQNFFNQFVNYVIRKFENASPGGGFLPSTQLLQGILRYLSTDDFEDELRASEVIPKFGEEWFDKFFAFITNEIPHDPVDPDPIVSYQNSNQTN